MNKWYLSTPMSGKTEKEIKVALQRGIEWVKERGDEYLYPYNPNNIVFNDNNEVEDPKPIAMLAKAIEPMDDCSGLLFIGDMAEFYKSKGCQVEMKIAEVYGFDIRII